MTMQTLNTNAAGRNVTMTSQDLHARIALLFAETTLDTINTTINYLFRLERYAERHNMIDVADHAQVIRMNLTRRANMEV